MNRTAPVLFIAATLSLGITTRPTVGETETVSAARASEVFVHHVFSDNVDSRNFDLRKGTIIWLRHHYTKNGHNVHCIRAHKVVA